MVKDWMKTVGSVSVKFSILPSRSPISRSRNAGIALSTGNIIAFIDDDCTADHLWVEELYRRLISSPGFAGVGGKVLPLGDDIYSAYYTVYRILEPPEHINAVITANCIFWKQPVVDAGLFDEYFGSAGGEEIGLSMKLWNRGYRFGYEEQAIVYHDYRKGLKNFIRAFYRYGNGERKIYENQPEEYLRFMLYPEQLYNNLAFRNPILFQGVFSLRMVVGIFLQWPNLQKRGISFAKKVMLPGLYAIAQFSYHLGRGTFSGSLVKTVRRFREDNEDRSTLRTVIPR
jgi:glycosyltransferase involved in cell wall biosynthesis